MENLSKNIKEVLETLGTESKSWVTIATLLLRVEQTEFWRQSHSSFSAWLSDTAKSLGVKNSLLWRYRRAAIFYNKFHSDNIIPKALCLPDLKHLQASPDNIDLLEKLSRVLPDRELIPLVIDVVSKQVGRRELLEKWQALREVLGGRTARGKGVLTPRVAQKDMDFGSYLEDKVLSIIQAIGPSWMGIEHASRYQILRTSSYRFLGPYKVDAIAIVQKNDSDNVEFHGIDIKAGLIELSLDARHLPNEAFFDYVWITLTEMPDAELLVKVPEHIGVVFFDDHNVTIIRQPSKTDNTAVRKIDLANEFLLSLLPK